MRLTQLIYKSNYRLFKNYGETLSSRYRLITPKFAMKSHSYEIEENRERANHLTTFT